MLRMDAISQAQDVCGQGNSPTNHSVPTPPDHKIAFINKKQTICNTLSRSQAYLAECNKLAFEAHTSFYFIYLTQHSRGDKFTELEHIFAIGRVWNSVRKGNGTTETAQGILYLDVNSC